MKISHEAHTELKKIRAAMDDMYDKLNVTLYEKHVATKVSYLGVNPFDSVTDNFQYISSTIRNLQDSEIVGDE
mgnify:FL=1